MKNSLLCGLMCILIMGGGHALGEEQDDIARHPACLYCGMDRAKFAHSRMQVTYDDGSVLGTCSVHCAALDMALFTDKAPVGFGVGDYVTRKLIDAEKAYWVIGGDQPGVMSARAKWAFEKKADADQFVRKHGGKAAGFEEILEATYADMYKDTQMVREKRRKMREKHH